MLLDGNMKRIALLAAVDICLRRMKNSPKRCARNLIELGTSAYPGKITDVERTVLYKKLLASFEDNDIGTARALFTSIFF